MPRVALIEPLYVKEGLVPGVTGSEGGLGAQAETVFFWRITPGEFDFFEIQE